MLARERIQKRIEEKQGEITEFEAKARDAKIYLQALEDTLRMLPKDPTEDVAAFSLRPGTNVDKVREMLDSKGSPMHINELLKGLGKPEDNSNRAALAGSLSAYVRKGQIFTRPAPNTFGLVEFPGRMPVMMPRNGPPPNFGIDEPPEEGDQAITDADVAF